MHICQGADISVATSLQKVALGWSMVYVAKEKMNEGEGKQASELLRKAIRLDNGREMPFEGEAWELLCKVSRVTGGGGSRSGELACGRAVELGRSRAAEGLLWAKGQRGKERAETIARGRIARERREREDKERRKESGGDGWQVNPQQIVSFTRA